MSTSAGTGGTGNRSHIVFIVDDDLPHLQVCERVLRAAGYLVLTAENGSAVSRTIETNPVDLLLIDMFMPEQDGIETIAAVRRRDPKLPIIAMSGGSMVMDPKVVLQQVKRLGANATLAKPFSEEELLRTVRSCLAATAD